MICGKSPLQLNDMEKNMWDGRYGKAVKWAMGYQQRAGEFFDADDLLILILSLPPQVQP